MGYFFSIISWVYKPNLKLQEIKIKLQASRFVKRLRLKQASLQNKMKAVENNLIIILQGPKQSRIIEAQKSFMNDIVCNSWLFAAYQQLINCANIISNQAHILEKNSSQISKQCIIAICSVLYCYKGMNLEDSVNLNELIGQIHPEINESQISQALRKCLSYKKAQAYELNLYALQLSQRRQISLQKINETGHNFKYNPIQKQQQHSKSQQMFAASFDEFQSLDEQAQSQISKKSEPQKHLQFAA